MAAPTARAARRRALRGYLCGLGLVAVAAGCTEAADSWLPLALAAAAAVMLTVPLVRSFGSNTRA